MLKNVIIYMRDTWSYIMSKNKKQIFKMNFYDITEYYKDSTLDIEFNPSEIIILNKYCSFWKDKQWNIYFVKDWNLEISNKDTIKDLLKYILQKEKNELTIDKIAKKI